MSIARTCDNDAKNFRGKINKQLEEADFKDNCTGSLPIYKGCKCVTNLCNHASFMMTSRSLALLIAAVTSLVIY